MFLLIYPALVRGVYVIPSNSTSQDCGNRLVKLWIALFPPRRRLEFKSSSGRYCRASRGSTEDAPSCKCRFLSIFSSNREVMKERAEGISVIELYRHAKEVKLVRLRADEAGISFSMKPERSNDFKCASAGRFGGRSSHTCVSANWQACSRLMISQPPLFSLSLTVQIEPTLTYMCPGPRRANGISMHIASTP